MKVGQAVLAAGLVAFVGLGSVLAQGTQGTSEARFRKFHIRAAISFLASDIMEPKLFRELDDWGFGEVPEGPDGLWIMYPQLSGQERIDLQVDYSATPAIALGLAVSLNNTSCSGYSFDVQELDARVKGTALFLTASYMPPTKHGRFVPRAGLGAGVNLGQATFETNMETRTFKKSTLSGLTFIGLDYRVLSGLTVGLLMQYRYIPFKTEAFEISGQYDSFGEIITATKTIPAAGYGLSGFALGIEAGLHF
jgi:hypothetical protein